MGWVQAEPLLQIHAPLLAAPDEANLMRGRLEPGAKRAHEPSTKGFVLGQFNFHKMLEAARKSTEARSQAYRLNGEITVIKGGFTCCRRNELFFVPLGELPTLQMLAGPNQITGEQDKRRVDVISFVTEVQPRFGNPV